jgi:hypothetical protein
LEFKHPIDFTFSKRPPVPANHKSSVTQSIMGRFDFSLSQTSQDIDDRVQTFKVSESVSAFRGKPELQIVHDNDSFFTRCRK